MDHWASHIPEFSKLRLLWTYAYVPLEYTVQGGLERVTEISASPRGQEPLRTPRTVEGCSCAWPGVPLRHPGEISAS